MITIDSVVYDVPILSITRKADFLDKYAERTVDGVLHRELIGTYFNYQIKFGTTDDMAVYTALWDKLTEPVEFHSVVVPDGANSTFTFQAYFSGVSDEIRKSYEITGLNYWKGLSANFTAQSPARS